MKKAISALASLSLIIGCQSNAIQSEEITPKTQQDPLINAVSDIQELTYTNAQGIIEAHHPITIPNDFTVGKQLHQDKVYASIALQQAELASKPVLMSQTVQLSETMYNGDKNRFEVPIASLMLERQGIEQAFDVSVIPSEYMWKRTASKDMDRAIWNSQSLDLITVSEMSTANETDHINRKDTKRGQYYLSVRYDFTNPEFFTFDKKQNTVYASLELGEGYPDGRDEYLQYYPATPQEAPEMIGKDVTLVYRVDSVFKINKTNQIIVVVNPNRTAITDEDYSRIYGSVGDKYSLMEHNKRTFLNYPENLITERFRK